MVNWQQVTPSDAIMLCERWGFKTKEIDFFAMEEKEYYIPNTTFTFKYRIQNSDPVKFFILPTIDNKSVTVEEFKQKVTEYYNEKQGK